MEKHASNDRDHIIYDCPITTCLSCNPRCTDRLKCPVNSSKLLAISTHKASICKLPIIPAVIDSAATGIFLQSSSSITNYTPYSSDNPSSRISVGNGDIIVAAGHGQLGKTTISADHVPNFSMNLVGLSSILKIGKLLFMIFCEYKILNGTAPILNNLINLIINQLNRTIYYSLLLNLMVYI